jgi:hypothetical protein
MLYIDNPAVVSVRNQISYSPYCEYTFMSLADNLLDNIRLDTDDTTEGIAKTDKDIDTAHNCIKAMTSNGIEALL